MRNHPICTWCAKQIDDKTLTVSDAKLFHHQCNKDRELYLEIVLTFRNKRDISHQDTSKHERR